MEFGFRPWLLTLPMPPRARGFLLRAYGSRVGTNVRVHPLRVINARWRNLSIGNDCYLGADVLLDLADELTLGDRVTIAARAMVFTHQDPGDARVRMRVRHAPVHFAPDTFVGAGAIVLAGSEVSGIVAAGVTAGRHDPRTG